MGLHGELAISTPENHTNRRFSGSGPIPDERESEGAIVNAMIECSYDLVVRSRDELLEMVSKF